MVTRKLNKKTKMMDFFVDGKLAGSCELDVAAIAETEAELRAAAHKYLALHG